MQDYVRAIQSIFLAPCVLCLSGQAAPSVHYRLDWQDDNRLECTEPAAFAESVHEQLGRSVFDPNAAASITVALEADDARWDLRLVQEDETGKRLAERRLSSAPGDCTGLVSGAVLTLEMLLGEDPNIDQEALPEAASGIDSVSSAEPDAPVPETDTVPSADVGTERPSTTSPNALLAVPEQPTPAEPQIARPGTLPGVSDTDELYASSDPASANDVQLQATVGAALYSGVLPDSALGVNAVLALEFMPRIWLGGGLGVTQPVTTTVDVEGADVKTTLALSHLHLALGWAAIERQSVSLVVSARGDVGMLETDVSGARSLGRDTHLWSAVGSEVFLHFRLQGPLLFGISSGLVIPLSSREFGVVDGPVLARLPGLGGMVGLRLGVQL